jgi:membrane protein DedA with SNARE-associated domain
MFAAIFAFKLLGWLKKTFDYLIAFGPLGMFGIALLDSALVPLPGGPDAAMMFLTAQRPGLMPLFALAGAAGSVIGCLMMYSVSRKAGERALRRFSERKRARVKDLLDRYDMFAVAGASLMPPPFPFKLFVISSGVFQMNAARFALGVGIGRGLRFLLEGFLVIRYGPQVKETLERHAREVGFVCVILIALAAVFFIARNMLKKKDAEEIADEPVAGIE